MKLRERCYALGAVRDRPLRLLMKSLRSFRILVPLLLVIIGAVSCDGLLRSFRNDPEDDDVARIESATDTSVEETVGTQSLSTVGDSQRLANEVAGIAITLPSSWTADTRLHDSAELEASDVANELYLVVVAEDAEPLMRLGLRENAANYRQLLTDQLAVYEGQTPTDVAFINGDFASQYEIRGRLADDTPVVYLHTTVLSEENYYQIVAWTTPQQYEDYRSDLRTITETFQEIES